MSKGEKKSFICVCIISRIKIILYLGFYMRIYFVNCKHYINVRYYMFVTCRLKIWTLLETMNLSWPMAMTGEWITSQWDKCGAFWFEDHVYVTTLKIAPLFFFSKARKEWVYINLYHKDSGSLLLLGQKFCLKIDKWWVAISKFSDWSQFKFLLWTINNC